MVFKEKLKNTVDNMILSASGWRGVFAECEGSLNEESASDKISEAHRIISASASLVFYEYLKSRENRGKTLIYLGTDTRPTGKAIIEAMIPVLLANGCDVRYAGITAAPEIMAWARKTSTCCSGFIYISASHNPVGHNGIKFGLTDGGVLAADEAVKLIDRFRSFINSDDCAAAIENLISAADPNLTAKVYENISIVKSSARNAYYDFCGEVAWDSCTCPAGDFPAAVSALKDGLIKRPLGIVCDFNGSARTVSIDRDFLSSLGFGFESINSEPGQIAHRIVPEGESLLPCAVLLEEAHSRDPSFILGYVPDCDGDRGNLVIWDDKSGSARPLEAQEVFALACVAEFSHLVWTKNSGQVNKETCKAAVVVNDPTSMRIDRIAEAFGVSVFRSEVGEANVVSLARKLRDEGYLVRILGEGSAGGNITHPSAVRDPINTVLAIAKLLCIRSPNNNDQRSINSGMGGLFKIWCSLSGQIEKYNDDFSLADIIASLPPFVTTSAYNKDAGLRIKTSDHSLLKERYQQIFLREWENRKDELKSRYGFQSWEAVAYNGTAETRDLKHFGEAGRGGLKIIFKDSEDGEIAYIWMRGSATEPVFRVIADVKGSDILPERDLLDWQRKMIMEADS